MAGTALVDEDLYGRLGVAPGATDDELTAAFRARAKELHPDLNPGDRRVAEEFKALTHAYTVLTDADARRAYDEQRARTAPADLAFPTIPASQPVFRTPRTARIGIWSGVALLVAGVIAGVVLASVPTGDEAKTITLWIVAVKLVVCGVILAAAGGWRLQRLQAEAAGAAREPTDR